VSESKPYEVHLEVFEGPLDLLLYLIKKNDLEITDIPLSQITGEYLAFLDQVHRLDLEQASSFILMAATLMRIKAQMLLPREELPGEEEEPDPRAELVRHLLEYQQFREVAEWLGLQGVARRDIFLRRAGSGGSAAREAGLHPVSLFDLLKAYQYVVDHVPREVVHQIVEARVSVEECIAQVLAALEQRQRLRFAELVQGKGRMGVVATFIGLLELLKLQRIRVQQARPFDEIWIERRAAAVPAAGGPN